MELTRSGRAIVYCDRVTAASARAAIRLKTNGPFDLYELDPPRRTLLRRLLTGVLRRFGVDAREAPFFAGDLYTHDGESVYLSARRRTTQLALQAAAAFVDRVPSIQQINRRFGRDVIRLYLARTLWAAVERQVMQVLIVEALEHPVRATLLLARPLRVDESLIAAVSPDVQVVFYVERGLLFAKFRYVLPWVLKTMAQRVLRFLNRPSQAPASQPGLLMLQEDDLSMDRSHRTQPHWLMPSDPPLAFPAYVLTLQDAARLPTDIRDLTSRGVTPVSREAVRRFDVESDDPLSAELTAAAWLSVKSALRARTPADAIALSATIRVLFHAARLVPFCRTLNIRVFLSGETHLLDADAMQLVAQDLRIRTIAYQYSNLAFATPVMLTTADLMVTFSSHYHRSWTADDISPRGFANAGYLYDASFDEVLDRARQWRQQLVAHGAEFVICYFDENVARNKYGLTSAGHHVAELRALVELLLRDPTIGLIVKTQFERNSPSSLHAGDALFERAQASGRYLELCHGVHRNIVFPAEAALAADIAIGHIVGATAPLEAACAGTRSVMLNPYRMKIDVLYEGSDIVFASIDDVLQGVASLRAGDPAASRFGDWTAILPRVDPFRDGRAAGRLRQIVERAVIESGFERTAA